MKNKKELNISSIDSLTPTMYYQLLIEYGEQKVKNAIEDYVKEEKKKSKDLIQTQNILWQKLGYYFSISDKNPFQEDILKLFEQNSKTQEIPKSSNQNIYTNFNKEKTIFTKEEEIYYGFHLLKRNYINIFSADDSITIDIEKIFSSIKSAYAFDIILKKFEFMYNNCTRNSNFDLHFQNELLKYKNLFTEGKIKFKSNNLKDINDIILIEQVKMYVDYSIARDKFFLNNIFLAHAYSIKLTNKFNCEAEEIFTYAIMGISRSIDTFDIRLGHKFSTYAYRGMKNAIYRNFNENANSIRLPIYLRTIYYQIFNAKNAFITKYNRKPTIKELSEITNYSEEKIQEVLLFIKNTSCLNLESIIFVGEHEDDKILLIDSISSEEDTFNEVQSKLDFQTLLDDMKAILTDKEIGILLKRCGYNCDGPLTLEEVAKDYNVTRERIRQIETKAIKKLTRNRNIKTFNPYN